MQSNIIRSEIVELDLNEIEAVAGGATYSATLSYTSTAYTTTYVKPTSTTYVRPTLSSTSLSTFSAPMLL